MLGLDGDTGLRRTTEMGPLAGREDVEDIHVQRCCEGP